MPEWIRSTLEVVNTGLLLICAMLLFIILESIMTHRRKTEETERYKIVDERDLFETKIIEED